MEESAVKIYKIDAAEALQDFPVLTQEYLRSNFRCLLVKTDPFIFL